VNSNSKNRWRSSESWLGRQRVLLIVGVLGFLAAYQWAYINWVFPRFGYYGFDYNPPPQGYLILAWVLGALPCLWMPLNLTRPSQLAYWILYLTVIIPSMFVPLYVGLNQPREIALLMVTMFLGFIVTGLGYLMPLFPFRYTRISSSLFWKMFGLLAAGVVIVILVSFRHNLRLVSFYDIYDVRDESRDVAGGGLVNYALMWLYGAISPFLVGWGMYYKRKSLLLAGILGQVLVYSSFGTKASVLSVVFIGAFYFLLRRGGFNFSVRMIWSLVGLYLALVAVSFLLEGSEWELPVSLLLFLVFARTFGLAGLLTGHYYYFFQTNPHTYYSHLKIISLFVHYPYRYPLGTEVGYFYYDPLVDTTAHVWATDGIAAWGLVGILLASAFCAFLFWGIDSVSQKHDPRLAALVLSYAVYNLGNLSLFTTVLSGGMGLLVVFLYFLPARKESLGNDSRRMSFVGSSESAPLPSAG